MLLPFPDAVTRRCSIKTLFLKFYQFSWLWQSLASWCRESSIAKISSLDEAKFPDPPLILPFKSCEASSWQHLHSFSVSTGSHFPHLHHSSTAWHTLLLLLSCSVSFISSSSLKKMAFEENLFLAQTENLYRTSIHFIGIRLFSRIFYSFTRDSWHGVMIKMLYFQ